MGNQVSRFCGCTLCRRRTAENCEVKGSNRCHSFDSNGASSDPIQPSHQDHGAPANPLCSDVHQQPHNNTVDAATATEDCGLHVCHRGTSPGSGDAVQVHVRIEHLEHLTIYMPQGSDPSCGEQADASRPLVARMIWGPSQDNEDNERVTAMEAQLDKERKKNAKRMRKMANQFLAVVDELNADAQDNQQRQAELLDRLATHQRESQHRERALQESLREQQRREGERLQEVKEEQEAKLRGHQEQVMTFVLRLEDRDRQLLQTIDRHIDGSQLSEVVRRLYQEYDIRLLGVDSGLTFLMEAPMAQWVSVVERQLQIEAIVGELLPEEGRQEVTWQEVSPCDPCSGDIDLHLGQNLPVGISTEDRQQADIQCLKAYTEDPYVTLPQSEIDDYYNGRPYAPIPPPGHHTLNRERQSDYEVPHWMGLPTHPHGDNTLNRDRHSDYEENGDEGFYLTLSFPDDLTKKERQQPNMNSEDTEKKEPISDDTEKKEPISDDTEKKEPISDDTEKKEPISDDTEKKEPISDDTEKKEPISDNTEKKEPISDDTEKKEPISDDTEKKEPISDDTEKKEPISDDTEKKEPISDDTEKKEPISDDTEKKEPISDDTEKKEPISDDTEKKEPISDDTEKKEPISDDTEKKEPISDDTEKKEPIKNEEDKKQPQKIEPLPNTTTENADSVSHNSRETTEALHKEPSSGETNQKEPGTERDMEWKPTLETHGKSPVAESYTDWKPKLQTHDESPITNRAQRYLGWKPQDFMHGESPNEELSGGVTKRGHNIENRENSALSEMRRRERRKPELPPKRKPKLAPKPELPPKPKPKLAPKPTPMPKPPEANLSENQPPVSQHLNPLSSTMTVKEYLRSQVKLQQSRPQRPERPEPEQHSATHVAADQLDSRTESETVNAVMGPQREYANEQEHVGNRQSDDAQPLEVYESPVSPAAGETSKVGSAAWQEEAHDRERAGKPDLEDDMESERFRSLFHNVASEAASVAMERQREYAEDELYTESHQREHAYDTEIDPNLPHPSKAASVALDRQWQYAKDSGYKGNHQREDAYLDLNLADFLASVNLDARTDPQAHVSDNGHAEKRKSPDGCNAEPDPGLATLLASGTFHAQTDPQARDISGDRHAEKRKSPDVHDAELGMNVDPPLGSGTYHATTDLQAEDVSDNGHAEKYESEDAGALDLVPSLPPPTASALSERSPQLERSWRGVIRTNFEFLLESLVEPLELVYHMYADGIFDSNVSNYVIDGGPDKTMREKSRRFLKKLLESTSGYKAYASFLRALKETCNDFIAERLQNTNPSLVREDDMDTESVLMSIHSLEALGVLLSNRRKIVAVCGHLDSPDVFGAVTWRLVAHRLLYWSLDEIHDFELRLRQQSNTDMEASPTFQVFHHLQNQGGGILDLIRLFQAEEFSNPDLLQLLWDFWQQWKSTHLE